MLNVDFICSLFCFLLFERKEIPKRAWLEKYEVLHIIMRFVKGDYNEGCTSNLGAVDLIVVFV